MAASTDDPSILQAQANVTQAEQDRKALVPQLQKDTAAYDTRIGEDEQRLAQVDQYSPAPPVFSPELPMKTAPLALLLAAMGGKATSASGLTMLRSSNAMLQGFTEGNVEGYQRAYQTYRDEYSQWADKQKLKDQIFRDLRDAYKGRVDGDRRALEIAEKAVGDARIDYSRALSYHEAEQRIGEQIRQHDLQHSDRAAAEAERERKDKEAEAEREKRMDLDTRKFEQAVKNSTGKDLDAQINDIGKTISSIRKDYELKPMPPEVAEKVAHLKELMQQATMKRIQQEQPEAKAKMRLAADSAEGQQAIADAQQAVKQGLLTKEEAEKRLAAAGIDYVLPGQASGYIHRQGDQ